MKNKKYFIEKNQPTESWVEVQGQPMDTRSQIAVERYEQELKKTFSGAIEQLKTMKSQIHPERVEILLLWRSTAMPDEIAREQALNEFRRELASVLDWNSAQYDHSEVILHT